MATIELELSDELEARLKRAADRNAVSPSDMAKFILAQQLTREKSTDWMGLIQKGREVLAFLMHEAKKEG